MPSIKCLSFEEIEQDQCTVLERGKRFLMGGDLASGRDKPEGIFYLETLDDSPYAIRDVNKFTKINIIDHNLG